MTEATVVELAEWRVFGQVKFHPILAAAREAFQDRGYHATSVREIAEAVGLTVPAIYYHYGSKQGLLVSLLVEPMKEVARRCRLAVEDAGPDPRRRLTFLVEALVLWSTHRHYIAVLDYERRSLEPRNRNTYVAYRDEVEAMVNNVLMDGVAAGVFEINRVALVRRAILSMVRGIPTWYREGGELTPADVVSEHQDLALRMVEASPRGRAEVARPETPRDRRR